MKEIKNQLPEGIMGNIQCILSATSIEEITKLELRVKEMLKIFVDFYPHKKCVSSCFNNFHVSSSSRISTFSHLPVTGSRIPHL